MYGAVTFIERYTLNEMASFKEGKAGIKQILGVDLR